MKFSARQTWQRKTKTNQPKKKREPSPALRKRLQKLFEAGNKQGSQDKFDYASDLYTECVRGDPGNLEYLQSFMTNLHKKYGSAKKLGPMVQFKERGARAALKKAIAQCDWDEAIQQGFAVLLVNPWDVPTLTAMATACGGIMTQEGPSAAVTYGDCELYYLKCAFDTFPKDKPDYEVCRQLAEALTKRERYVEAINFWHKVELARPDDELPKRSIATLTVLQHQAKDPKYEDGQEDDRQTGRRQAGGVHARGPPQAADPAQPEGPYRLRRVGKSLPEHRPFRGGRRGFQAEARGLEQRPHGAGRNRGRATPRPAFQDGRGRQEGQGNGQRGRQERVSNGSA